MSIFTTNAGLGIPSSLDTDFVTTITNTFNLLDSFEGIGQHRVRLKQNPSTSLVVSYSGGILQKNNGAELTVAGADLTMTASQTNYIFVDSAGTLSQNTTGFPASVSQLCVATVVAGVSSITSIVHSKRAYRQSGIALSGELLALTGGTLTGLLVLSGTGANAGFQFSTTAAPGSPVDGQLWYDSTAKCLLGSIAGATQRFPSVQYLATASATVANTTAETTIVGSGQGLATLPANLFAAGKTVRIKGSGFISTTGSPTATVNLKLGSYSLTTGAVAPGTGVSNVAFRFEAEFTCRTPGASGTFIGQANVAFNGTSFPATPSTGTSVLDTTGALAVAATLTWSAASASNTATVTNFTVEILN